MIIIVCVNDLMIMANNVGEAALNKMDKNIRLVAWVSREAYFSLFTLQFRQLWNLYKYVILGELCFQIV